MSEWGLEEKVVKPSTNHTSKNLIHRTHQRDWPPVPNDEASSPFGVRETEPNDMIEGISYVSNICCNPCNTDLQSESQCCMKSCWVRPSSLGQETLSRSLTASCISYIKKGDIKVCCISSVTSGRTKNHTSALASQMASEVASAVKSDSLKIRANLQFLIWVYVKECRCVLDSTDGASRWSLPKIRERIFIHPIYL